MRRVEFLIRCMMPVNEDANALLRALDVGHTFIGLYTEHHYRLTGKIKDDDTPEMAAHRLKRAFEYAGAVEVSVEVAPEPFNKP